MGAQGLIEVVHGLELRGLVEVALREDLLEELDALLGEHHRVGLLVLGVELLGVLSPEEVYDRVVGLVVFLLMK